MPHNSSGDSLVSDQKRREYVGDDFSDDSVGMGLDNAPSPSNFVRSPKNNDVHMSDESDTTPTTPTTPTSGTLFLSKTNFSSWRDDYPLDGAQVSPILLEKVQKFTMLRRTGGDINRDLKKQKGFKNPHLLERLIQTNGLYETGSNFRKEIYNPKQWQESSFFDSLSKEQGKLLDEEKKKQEKEQLRKENEKKRPPQHRDDNRSNKRYK